MITGFGSQIRYAARSLRASPAFTLSVTASLAITIGAVATAYSAFQALVIRPVSYPEADRIIAVSTSAKGVDQDGALAPDADAWRRRARMVSGVATYRTAHLTLTAAGDADELDGASVSSDFLRVLSVVPAIGRDFTASDEIPTAEPTVMVSDKLWSERFGRDPRLIGRDITLDGIEYRVIAIGPRELNLPIAAQFWTALRRSPAGGAIAFVSVIARLKPGVTALQARAELTAIVRSQETTRPALFPARLKNLEVIAVPLRERLYGAARPVLVMLIAAVAALLIITCVNVANLMLGRVLARKANFAIRVALGAGPAQLFRTTLAESCLLATLAGAGGILVARLGDFVFGKAAGNSAAAVQELRFDGGMVALAVIVAALIGLMLAVVPMISVWRAYQSRALALDAGRSTAGYGHQRLRMVFVSAQVAGTLPLITAAAVMAQSLANVLAIDVGFRHDHLVTADVKLSRLRYQNAQATLVFFERLADRVQGLPGVKAVAFSGTMPLRGIATLQPVATEDVAKPDVQVAVANVSEAFVSAAGLELLAGRAFGAGDVRGSEPVALVSAAAAKALFPEGAAVGHRLGATFSGSDLRPMIIGVVKDVPQLEIESPPKPQVYLPISQFGGWPTILVVRTSVEANGLGGAIRRAVSELDPLQAVRTVRTMDETIDASLASRRRNAAIVETLAGIAVVLSAIGLYGLVSYQVRSRTKEFGIRLALGAPPAHVLALTVQRLLAALVPSLAIGVLAAIAASRVLQKFVYGTSSRDPKMLLAAALVLVAAALTACVPGLVRAARIDPVITLREG